MDKLIKNFEQAINKVIDNRYLQSISRGMVSTITLTMVGSIIGLIKMFPIESSLFDSILNTSLQFSSNLLAFWAMFFIGGNVANSYGQEKMFSGMLTIYSYMLLLPGNIQNNAEFLSWLGPRGTVSGILLALLVGTILGKISVVISKFVQRDDEMGNVNKKTITILLLTALIIVMKILISLSSYESFVVLISRTVLIPLQAIGGSMVGVVFAIIIMNLLFYFGIHGATIVLPFMSPIWVSYSVDNLMANAYGNPSPHIIESGLLRIYTELGGASGMIGLLLCMLLFAKSSFYKSKRKEMGISTLCSIGEPMMFGLPLVKNKDFLIPMVLSPVVSFVIAYLSISLGYVPRLSGISVPAGVPIIIDSLVVGGIKHVALQSVTVLISMCIYLPFFLVSDRKN